MARGCVARWRDGAAALDPLLRLAVIAVIAAAIALIGWLPFLLAAIGGAPGSDSGTRPALPAGRRRRS